MKGVGGRHANRSDLVSYLLRLSAVAPRASAKPSGGVGSVVEGAKAGASVSPAKRVVNLPAGSGIGFVVKGSLKISTRGVRNEESHYL